MNLLYIIQYFAYTLVSKILKFVETVIVILIYNKHVKSSNIKKTYIQPL